MSKSLRKSSAMSGSQVESFQDCRVLNLKLLLDWIERDLDSDAAVFLIHNLVAENCGAQSRYPLLSVNQNLLAFGLSPIFESYVWIFPRDQVPNREALVERVHEV